MAKYLIKQIPLNWYKYDSVFSIELLSTFVRGIEKQVKTNIYEYESKEERIIFEIQPDTQEARVIEEYDDLDSETWDLDTIYKEHFPNLQRRSAFTSLYSFLENELNKLCDLYKNSNEYSIDYKDLKGMGIERSIKYLILIANLPIDKSTENWHQIKSIQKLRNLIIHGDGKLIDMHGNPKKVEREIVSQNEHLECNDEIIIKEGFLNFVLMEFEKLFMHIDDLIQKQVLATK